MMEVLITLMNAPRVVQRWVAAGVFAAGVALIIVIFASLATLLSAKINHIEEMRTDLFRLGQIIARRPPAALSFNDKDQVSALFLEGSGLPLIQAGLQARVNAAASASGATVVSISGTNSPQIDGVTYAGVRADIQGNLQAFRDVIRQLETSSPPLIIRQASIRSTNVLSQGKLSNPVQLSGQIVVYGAINPALSMSEKGRP